MKFIKIASNSFKCILSRQDFEDYNLTIHDFIVQDSDKIKSFITDICQRAEEETGIHLDGHIMSIQMAPQPDQTTVLTISTRNDMDELFGDLKKDLQNRMPDAGHLIQADESESAETTDNTENKEHDKASVYAFANYRAFEEFAAACGKTWGIINSLRKADDGRFLLVIKKGRASQQKYKAFCLKLLDYAECLHGSGTLFFNEQMEHSRVFIRENAVNKVRKYL